MRFAPRLISTLFAAILFYQGCGQTASLTTTQILAAYLLNFSAFITWPEGSFQADNDPINYCIIGNLELKKELSHLLVGETSKGHPLQLYEPTSVIGTKKCHLLYIHSDDNSTSPSLLTYLKGLPVFTVSNTTHFLQSGGLAALVSKNKRIRPHINYAATNNTGIKISSKLLRISRIVDNDGGGQ